MSMHQSVQLECPKCGQTQEAVVWSSLNSMLDPDAKEALLHGEINVLHCKKCDNRAVIDTTFLYHDMEKRFTVQYYPMHSLRDDQFFTQFTPNAEIQAAEMSGAISKAAEYMLRPHIVFSMVEVARYILFRDSLFEKTKGHSQPPKPQP